MANFGVIERLTVDGVRVGETLRAEGWPGRGGGIPVHTIRGGDSRADEGTAAGPGRGAEPGRAAPSSSSRRMRRSSRSRSNGWPGAPGSASLAPAASVTTGSGEIFVAFSTGIRIPRGRDKPVRTTAHLDEEHLDPFFAAVVEAVEEATLDALAAADTVTGRDGRVIAGLPIERTLELLRAAGRLDGRGGKGEPMRGDRR